MAYGALTVTRERMWGQYRRPNEPVLVKLPADPDSHQRYLAKGFIFVRYGKDEDIPMAVLDTSAEQLQKIAPEPLAEDSMPATPELYVSDKPYKSRKKKKGGKK